MNHITNWLLSPFKTNLHFFFIILVLISSVDIYDFASRGFLPYSIYLFFHGYLIAYIAALIAYILPRYISTIYKVLLTLICFALFAADIISYCIYQEKFTADFLCIFAQTNTQEIIEFLEVYFSPTYILIILCTVLFITASYYILKRKLTELKKRAFYSTIAGIIIILSLIMGLRNPYMYNDAFSGRFIHLCKYISKLSQNIYDLEKYIIIPEITTTKERQPKNVVMIIGESFSKSHSSLYGYKRTTNPRLSSIADSLLYVYTEVKSADLGTIASFKCIMSTYKPEYSDSVEWYKCITMPTTMRAAGYSTHWVSNQSKIGIFDTAVGRYADLCDTQHFVGDKFAGMNRINYKDEKIIDLLQPLLKDTTENNFYIIQLMGSHMNFKHRYPENFNIFKPENYDEHPEHQRDNLAAYDNSILYNDSVVYEIMHLFENKEAVIFYFSDHAIDVYESSDDYIGHAKANNPASVDAGHKIPFMIYTSPLYKEKFPLETEQIKQCVKQPFRTDDIIYTIMDLVGIEFQDNDLEGKSLFRM